MGSQGEGRFAQQMRVIDLGTLGGPESKALDVNSSGQIVGKSLDPLGRTQIFLINPEDTNSDGKPDLWFKDLDVDGTNDLMVNLTPGETRCRPIKINERGQVLGEKYLGGPSIYYFVYFVIIPEDTNNDGAPDVWFQDDGFGHNALIVDIPTLGGTQIEAASLNNVGQVVGGSSTSAGSIHPFLWSASTGTVDLGAITPSDQCYATDINDRGQVVGWWSYLIGYYYYTRAFKITPVDTNGDGVPDLWFRDLDLDGRNDLMTELGNLGGRLHEAWFINEQGQIAGNGSDATVGSLPVIWDETGQPMSLGDTGGGWTETYAINEHGQVTGLTAVPGPNDKYVPFFWSPESGLQVLDGFGRETSGFAINNLGQVVCSDDQFNYPLGPQAIKIGTERWAYLWSAERGRIDIVGLDNLTNMCRPVDINDEGLMVGSSGSTTYLTVERAVLWIVKNTGAGTDVPVTPIDPVTGESPVTLSFGQVVEGGDTTLRLVTTGTPPPNGLKLGTPPRYYVLETTAVYSGPITICINYSGISYGKEENLKLFHNHSGSWEDVTTALDTVSNTICGQVMSLSEFALFEPAIIADGLEWPLADLVQAGQEVPLPDVAFKQGRTLPLKLHLYAGDTMLTDADVAPPKIVALTRSGNAIPLETFDLDSGQSNDNGSCFRFAEGFWVFNLSTKGLTSGTYTIILEMPDGQLMSAGFVLR